MFNGEMLSQLGSAIAGLMFAWAMFKQYVPYGAREYLEKYTHKFVSFVYPFIQITFHEYTNNGFERSKAFTAIERYLGTNSSDKAKRLKADMVKDSQSLVLSMDDQEEITDEFQGIKIWWASRKRSTKSTTFSFYGTDDEKRSYTLTFHKKYRDTITKSYLSHVLEEGKAIQIKTRQRKLFTNNRTRQYSGYGRSTMWSQVIFEHPANFNTLGMDPKKKQDIINDLITFSKAKDYYQKIGKAWKRGYLLYGPPGTGKSTMIAAMANLLEYDVYDLELTAVKDNTELRRLLIDTSNKAIIVIEDIDCSLDLTGQRKEKEEEKDEKDPAKKMVKKEDDSSTKVTLSGLLNFIDGLWSSCGGERLIVFTTNYLEKLDPALIRRGRMDKHIELSYCCFESFKVLARNYLDVESHELFETIRVMLEETKMTPADVAENLMPKSADDDAETSLRCLIKGLETAKEDAKLKAEKEEKEKAEKEAKEKEKETEEKEAKEKEKEKEEKSAEEVKEEKTTVEGVKENGVSK